MDRRLVQPRGIPATPWLEHLARHLPVARAGQDPEGVHQVRVAAARLAVWLRLGGRRMLADDLRWLRGSASEVRDLDVALGLGGPLAYLEDLRRRWAKARERMLVHLGSRRLPALMLALGYSPPIERAVAERRTARWLERAIRIGDRLDWIGVVDGELHSYRRRVRRLRYALDWTGRKVKAVKDLSEELGAVNDLAVLIERQERGDPLSGSALPFDDVRDRLAERRAAVAERWPALSKALTKGRL